MALRFGKLTHMLPGLHVTHAVKSIVRRYSGASKSFREPFDVRPGRSPKWVSSPEEAVGVIQSGSSVFIHGAAATPNELIKAMSNVASDKKLRNVILHHLHTEGDLSYLKPEVAASFDVKCFFIGSNMRDAVYQGSADYIPIFLSEIPLLLRRGVLPLDVAMVHVSPPDAHGYCSLGTSVDATRAAVQTAKYVIGQVNPQMPRTHGDGLIHLSQFDYLFKVDRPLPQRKAGAVGETERKIGSFIADNLVADGATLQMGIGTIPDALLPLLKDHKDLGVHTEMFADGIVELAKSGAITNAHKKSHPGKIVATFCYGTQKLYDFMHDNPSIQMLDVQYVNSAFNIHVNPKVTAINSAIEIDLTGQVVADSIGHRMFSGVGGQVDFMRGAALSEGGKPIIALPSATSKGESRIVMDLKPGAGVVTTRAHVHYVVTEYGIAELFGKSLRERSRALIAIAHPDHRQRLHDAAAKRFAGF